VTLYVTNGRPLTTRPHTHGGGGERERSRSTLDFVQQRVVVLTTTAGIAEVPLSAGSAVAYFYADIMEALAQIGVPDADQAPGRTRIPDVIRLGRGYVDSPLRCATRGRSGAQRYWRILTQTARRVDEVARVIGQEQPGAFILGRARPRADARFAAAHGAAASRRHSQPARRSDQRKHSRRGGQLRLHGGAGPCPIRLLRRTLIRRHRARAARVETAGRVLSADVGEFHPALDGGAHGRFHLIRRCSCSASRSIRAVPTGALGSRRRASPREHVHAAGRSSTAGLALKGYAQNAPPRFRHAAGGDGATRGGSMCPTCRSCAPVTA